MKNMYFFLISVISMFRYNSSKIILLSYLSLIKLYTYGDNVSLSLSKWDIIIGFYETKKVNLFFIYNKF